MSSEACYTCGTGEEALRRCLFDRHDGPSRWFCRQHYADHLLSDHSDDAAARGARNYLIETGIFPAGHPCKWHEGDEPIEQDSDPAKYMAPGCQGCGSMYNTKDCVGCGKEFLDWEANGFDDVIAGPYVTSSGDLYCTKCGPRFDRDEEAEDYDGDYYYPDGESE